MTPQLTQRLAVIRAECEEIITLGENADDGPWLVETETAVSTLHIYAEFEHRGEKLHNGYVCRDLWEWNANFIARSRTIAPAAARAVIGQIEGMQRFLTWDNAIVRKEAEENLQSLADNWPTP